MNQVICFELSVHRKAPRTAIASSQFTFGQCEAQIPDCFLGQDHNNDAAGSLQLFFVPFILDNIPIRIA